MNVQQANAALYRTSMTLPIVIATLVVPVTLAVVAGAVQLKRAVSKPKILPEGIALSAAWVFLVGSLFWLGVYLTDSVFLGFGAPWTWLTALHFAFAGFGALTITSLSCRVVSDQKALCVLRFLLIVHPVAYLATAAGIFGFRYCSEVGSVSYEMLFITQLVAVVFGRPDRMARAPLLLLVLGLMVPVATLVPAIAWAWKYPFFDMTEMIQYHGIVNAVGHVGIGLVAFAIGRPQSHSVVPMGSHSNH